MKIPVSREGRINMEARLSELKGPKTKELLEALKDARESASELTENTEYEVIKNEYDLLNMQISKLENDIKNSIVVDMDTISTESVQLFTKVKILNKTTKKEMEFTIVSENEINIKEGKISYNSPIGSSLVGKKIGEVAIATVPSGKMELEILNISI